MIEAAGRPATAPRSKRISRVPIMSRVAERFRRRPDSEHEMTINRLVFSLLILSYLLVAVFTGKSDVREPLVTISAYFAFSAGFFIHILLRPGISVPRRVLAMFVDLVTLSYGLHVGNEITSLLYPIYLWTIFGNGFRFGLKYLFLSTAISVAGFSVVVATTDYWWSHLYLAGGLLTGLIILPLYAATLIRKLSAARQQAEQASQAKSRFLASVSHELRTPLNAIIGLSDLMRDTTLDSEQQEMTRTIGTAGRSLLTLINSILDLSRIEERRMESRPVEFDLHALLADVRAILSVQASAKSVRLALHVTTRTPRFVKADRRHLEEILVNLGGNAVKFTERGQVVIAVDAVRRHGGEIRLRCEVSDTGIGIAPDAQARIFESFTQADETIIDRFGGTGLGLAIVKELVEFHRGEIGVESAPGAGSTFWFEIGIETAEAAASPFSPAGVSVVLLSPDERLRELLSASGADVRLVASPEKARPTVDLLRRQGVRRPVAVIDAGPRAADAVPAATALMGEAHAPMLILVTDEPVAGMPSRDLRSLFVTTLSRPIDGAGLAAALEVACGNEAPAYGVRDGGTTESKRKLAVLVAEDNRTNQMVIAKILRRAGHDVHLVDNGEAALDALDARDFDIVLMDVNMPVMNGIEATKLYRFASLGRERVPIIALTADATAEARARCDEAGMDACVTKPIEPARLLEIIEKSALDRANRAAAPPSLNEGVTRIAEHPKFRPNANQSLNRQTLDDLETIGGKDFVAELVAQFSGDAASTLRDLAAAAADGDVELFRERAHALRSAAANIGALGIYDMCLAWRQIGASELASRGHEYVTRLRDEMGRVRHALNEHAAAFESARPGSEGIDPTSRPAGTRAGR
jgi:two-component system sensor histidine kinase RpfC